MLLSGDSLWQSLWEVFVLPVIIGVIVLTIVLLLVRKILAKRETKKFSQFTPEVFVSPTKQTRKASKYPLSWKTVLLFPLLFPRFLYKNFKQKHTGNASQGDTFYPVWGFSSVAGADEAVEELQELVERLKTPERWTKWGLPAPKGALLWGPPGTGKTLLAKAVAAEAGVPFYALSGSDFVEKYVGVGASRVRTLFKKAKSEQSGAIIFIDEIDAIGRKRSSDVDTGNSEHESTLNALLVELDGFNDRNNIVVIGATNRPDLIDKALTRPGRLDRKIIVPLPDKKGREAILRTHIQGKPFNDNINTSIIAGRTPGLSGAELSQIVHEACLSAERENETTVSNEHLEHAVATVVMGKARRSAVVSDKDQRITAWHEAGHTTAAMVLPDADNPATVTIVPRGPAGGFTWTTSEDKHYNTVEQMKASIIVALAGRAAEEIHLNGTFTTGPSGDYTTATRLAYEMVAIYGMSGDKLISYGDTTNMVAVLAQNKNIETAVQQVLAESLNTARSLLRDNYELLKTVAEELLRRETLNSADLLIIKDTHTLGTPNFSPSKHT